MRALLLVIFAGLGTQAPDVEIKAFASFAECRIEAYRHIEAGRYAQCAAVSPDRDNIRQSRPCGVTWSYGSSRCRLSTASGLCSIADFRKALEIDPSDQDAKNNLKRLGATP